MSETEITEATETNSSEEESAEPRNHIAGCTIFIVILLTVIFVIGIATYTYYDYKSAFTSISEEKENPTQLVDTTDETATAALDKKFGEFSQLVKDKKPATLELTVDDINLAIAHFDKLKEFRNRLYVTGLVTSEDHENDLIETRACFKVKPGFNPERFMNGVVKYKPEIAEGSIFPIIMEAKPDTGNPVPPKILQALSTLMFTEYRNDESIKDVFHRINTAKVIDNKLVITSDPDDQVIAILDQTISEERKNEVIQYIVLICFIFFTTIAFAIWYRGFKKKRNAS